MFHDLITSHFCWAVPFKTINKNITWSVEFLKYFGISVQIFSHNYLLIVYTNSPPPPHISGCILETSVGGGGGIIVLLCVAGALLLCQYRYCHGCSCTLLLCHACDSIQCYCASIAKPVALPCCSGNTVIAMDVSLQCHCASIAKPVALPYCCANTVIAMHVALTVSLCQYCYACVANTSIRVLPRDLVALN
jgi:hypothetical protein